MREMLQILGLIAMPNFIVGARLLGCSSDRLSVDETSNTVITCDQFNADDTVTWTLDDKSPEPVTLGTCTTPTTCNQGGKYSLTRSSTQSTVTITPSSDLRTIGTKYRIQCDASGTTSCALDVVYPSVVPAQNCRVEARSVTWTIEGSCNITKTFSSSNNYQCQVFRGDQNSQQAPVSSVNYTTLSHSNASYRMGSCSFSSDFKGLLTGITSSHNFYFKIAVYPGPTSRVVGPVILQKPVSPTIRCPDIVAENTTFTCTCSTTNLGQPAGRLVWSRVTGGVIIEGEYGVTNLTLHSQTLTRLDHGMNKFRCDVRWAAGNYMAVYTGNIGFPPSQTVLNVTPATPGQTVNVSENEDVSFTCTTTDGNPKSTLTLLKEKFTIITTGSSPLIYSLGKAQCQHSGNYTCTAKNDYGNSVTSPTRLYVKCLPRPSEKIPAFNFIEKKDEITFPVTAYPVPTLNLLYIGKSDSTTGSPANLPDSIQMNGSCEAMEGMIHKSTCTITVYNVTSNEAAGFYQVTLTNEQGNTNATFEITYKAPVSPSQESQLGNAAVIGGVIGAVVVAGIIAVVVVIVLKRRKGHKKENNNSTAAGRPRNGQGQNSFHEKEEPGLADADPEAPSRPLSFAPMAVYAQVDKSKKSNPGAAAQEAEANGGQPADVYAVVEKTKKKQASGAGAKPKTVAKAAGKPKKEKKKKDESAHVYGNVRGAKAKKTSTPSKEETSSGKMVNPEGLIYTAVEFSQPPKSGKPAPKKPEEEPVVYSAVDFTKSPAP